MSQFKFCNVALDTTTTFNAGTSVTAAADVFMQLGLPSNQSIRLIEFGFSQDVATATSTQLKIQTCSAGSTLSTAGSTTLIKPLVERDGRASSLTMSTSTTAVHSSGANVSPATRTAFRDIVELYVPQVYVFQWPLGGYPVAVNANETIVQMLIKPTATVNVIAWMVWDEL